MEITAERSGANSALMKKQVLYGESNYGAIVHDNGYFVDKR